MAKNLAIRRTMRRANCCAICPAIRLVSMATPLLLMACATILLAACSDKAGQTATPSALPSPSPTVRPQATQPAPSASPTPGKSQLSLRIWVPPQFAVAAESPLFADVVSGFEAAYPGVKVELSVKRAFGKGGLLDLLQGAGHVAPGYLPDLILMDDAATASAAGQDLLEPLDAGLTTAATRLVFTNLLPIGMKGETRCGLPFAMDFIHLAYRTSMTVSVPLNWSSVLESGGRYLFASGGSEGYSGDAIFIQYIGMDGSLTNAEGVTLLDSRVLTRVLDAYKQMADQGSFAPGSLELNSPDEAWSNYRTGNVEFAEVWASQLKAEAASLADTAYAHIPTRNGRAATLAHVWVWSVPARTQERKEAAMRFLEWVVEPARHQAWCEAARLLPASIDAWPLPGLDTAYNGFLLGLAQTALPLQAALRSTTVSAALQQALVQVISAGIAPRQAAEQAVAAMNLQ